MKHAIWAVPAVLFTFAAAQAQPAPQTQQQAPAVQQPAQSAPATQQQAQPQVYGRGRGGLPWAWNDRDKDGICDLTGRPVGQRRAIGGGGWGDRNGDGICDYTGRSIGWGRGDAAWGRGWGRGRGGWWKPGYMSAPAPVQPPASAVPGTPNATPKQ